jgi:hypothetical protein
MLTEVVRPPFIPSKDDGYLTADKFGEGIVNISDYFEKLKSPAVLPSSPLRSPSSEFRDSVSFDEF